MTVHPEISFNALVVSLATSAAVHFGDAADPASGQKQPANVDAAGHMVDLLEARQGGDGVAAATPGAPGRS